MKHVKLTGETGAINCRKCREYHVLPENDVEEMARHVLTFCRLHRDCARSAGSIGGCADPPTESEADLQGD